MDLQIRWTTDEPSPAAGQLMAIPACADPDKAALQARFGRAVAEALASTTFAGKPGETFSFTRERSDLLERITVFGVGQGLRGANEARNFAHDVVRHAQSQGASRVVVDLRSGLAGALPWGDDHRDPVAAGSLLGMGALLGTYAYERFLSEDNRSKRPLKEICFWADTSAPAEAVSRARILSRSIGRARDLVNGPAGLVTPTFLAETAREIAEAATQAGADVQCKILEREDCEKLGMGCYLGVAQGSDEPPKFIHLAYRPRGERKGRACIIGKGVTFDSGGYSIKPSDAMLDMKMDMAGAAAVLSAFEALAELLVPWEVHAIVAATENMVSGRAYRLGDVLRASNGKTVEINNTDAEGRLTLADAMIYASKLEPDFMIDFATLTGACMVALGPRIAGVMTRDDELAAAWMAAAERTGEPMWRLPLPDDLKEQLKSGVADMKNTGERYGGALTAGLFLSEFTEGRRWMHVDIAGPAMASKGYGVTTPGGTGFAVATIVDLLSGDAKP